MGSKWGGGWMGIWWIGVHTCSGWVGGWVGHRWVMSRPSEAPSSLA